MNMDRIHNSGTRLSDPPTVANEPSPDAQEPSTKQSGRFLPSTRYRHPGDVIRLIGSGLVLTAMLAAVAVAPGRLTGADAATVTWLGSDPAGRLITGLVQVGFVAAAAGAVAVALRHRRFRLLAGLAAGAVAAGAALAGILYLAGNSHPEAVTAAGEQHSWLASAAFPWPPLLAAAVAVTVAAAPWLNRPWRRTAWIALAAVGAARLITGTVLPAELVLAFATGVTVGAGRAGGLRRPGPADRIRGDRGRAAVRRPARRLRRAGRRPDEGLPAVRGGHR